jgi:hypothetical protein
MVSAAGGRFVSANEKAARANVSYWRRSQSGASLDSDQAARQGQITTLAFLTLGRDQALAFLNEEHAGLGGRPLALAIESAEGRDRVEAEIGRAALR